MGEQGHGGIAVAKALQALGVDHLFTLTGGHIFPILDGCHQSGIRIVDTRHEQTAAFAAEGWARLNRSVGVCAVTAGPGVTNAISPLAQANFNQAPMVMLAGRAPEFRWGQGSLQEIDHVPFVGPLAHARTVTDTSEVAQAVIGAARLAQTPPRRPAFLDFPLDVLFGNTDIDIAPVEPLSLPVAAGDEAAADVAELIEAAQRPVLIAGSNVWLDRAEDSLLSLIEMAGLPCFTNGQGRGCVPADHELGLARSRSKALKEADLVIVAGTPMDFRLGFGQNFAPEAKVVHLDSDPSQIAGHVELAAAIGLPLRETFAAIADLIERPPDTKEWVAALRAAEEDKRQQAETERASSQTPIHPMRIYGELVPLLDRDAVVIGDGGDFVSYAGREIASQTPGCWLDPGPYGCLGMGAGYALAARLAHPDRQVVVLFGDGAIGFSGMDLESFVRHGLPATFVVGNNGIWGLEKHPMRGLYGYDVAAELQPSIRYDEMMRAFGGQGELVTDPDEVGPALRRALESGQPYLVNIVTDPEIAYPRSANLA
jgi:acetolactate synthase-1/2/3 large subunit